MENIVLKSNIIKDEYTSYVCEKYDLQIGDEITSVIPKINIAEIDVFKWNIGVLLGNSGSGKSTILNSLGSLKTPKYDNSKCIVSQFPQLSAKDVCELLCSVGLSSVPIWLHKPSELSNGERARLDLCWLLANADENEILLIDEYTSVVNRDCAKSLSFALQRYVRTKNIKIILASCHFDIIGWVKPDWVFNLNKQIDGKCEIERLIYKDDEDYDIYSKINNKDVLTKEFYL